MFSVIIISIFSTTKNWIDLEFKIWILRLFFLYEVNFISPQCCQIALESRFRWIEEDFLDGLGPKKWKSETGSEAFLN